MEKWRENQQRRWNSIALIKNKIVPILNLSIYLNLKYGNRVVEFVHKWNLWHFKWDKILKRFEIKFDHFIIYFRIIPNIFIYDYFQIEKIYIGFLLWPCRPFGWPQLIPMMKRFLKWHFPYPKHISRTLADSSIIRWIGKWSVRECSWVIGATNRHRGCLNVKADPSSDRVSNDLHWARLRNAIAAYVLIGKFIQQQ